MDARKKGGSSITAILFHKKVLPQNTYTEKKAMMINQVLRDKLMKSTSAG